MRGLFSLDSKFMTVMSRVADLIILNLLFLFTSIPIFTIGASTAAMYTLCFRFGTDREQGVFRSYFRAFRDNFKQATQIWLILLLCGAACCFDIYLFLSLPGMIRYLAAVFCIALVLLLLVFSYAFPLLSQFDNKNKNILSNALLLGLGYLPRSVLLVALNVLPWVLLATNIITFMQVGFLWVIIYFSGAAYVSTFLLKKIFAPYMSEEDSGDETDEESNDEETESEE